MNPNSHLLTVEAQDLNLAAVGADQLLEQHLPAIAQALEEQEAGTREGGNIVLTIKLTISPKEDGLRYGCSSTCKLPAFISRGARGHTVHRNGEPNALRVIVNEGHQSSLPFAQRAPATEATDEDVH